MIEREQAQLAAQAVMEERLRIARDLHDITAHSLGVIAVQAGVAAHVMRTEPDEAEAIMRSIAGTSREALSEIRGLVSALRSSTDDDYAPTPRLADLERLADEARAAGQDVDWRLASVPDDAVPATAQAAAYRIVQQALSNAREHAPGRAVVVDLTTANGELLLTVANPLGAGPPSPTIRRSCAAPSPSCCARIPASSWSARPPTASRPSSSPGASSPT